MIDIRTIARTIAPVIALAALSPAAYAANPKHPYGVVPYGFVYPTPSHIWGTLDKVYGYDMKGQKNWGPHGRGYYSCGPSCGPYGYGACGGLTPLHYNAISPANSSAPYPGLRPVFWSSRSGSFPQRSYA